MDRESEFVTFHLPLPLLSLVPVSIYQSVSVCLSACLSFFLSQVYLTTGLRPPSPITDNHPYMAMFNARE